MITVNVWWLLGSIFVGGMVGEAIRDFRAKKKRPDRPDVTITVPFPLTSQDIGLYIRVDGQKARIRDVNGDTITLERVP